MNLGKNGALEEEIRDEEEHGDIGESAGGEHWEHWKSTWSSIGRRGTPGEAWEDHSLEHHREEGEHQRKREAWEEHKEDGERCMGEPRLVAKLAGSGQDIAVGPSWDKRQRAWCEASMTLRVVDVVSLHPRAGSPSVPGQMTPGSFLGSREKPGAPHAEVSAMSTGCARAP